MILEGDLSPLVHSIFTFLTSKTTSHAHNMHATDAHISEVVVHFSVSTIYLTKLKVQPHFQRVAAPDKTIGTKNGFQHLIKESPKCS